MKTKLKSKSNNKKPIMKIKIRATVYRYFLTTSKDGSKIQRRIILTNFQTIAGDKKFFEYSYESIICSLDMNKRLFDFALNNGDVIEFEAEYYGNSTNHFRNLSNIAIISRKEPVSIVGYPYEDDDRNPYISNYHDYIESNKELDDDTLFHAYKHEFQGFEIAEGYFLEENLFD